MASAMIGHLIDQRLRAWDQAKDLLDRAEKEERDLSAEEQEQFKRINTDIDEFGARIKDLEEIEARRQDLEEQRKGFQVAVKSDASPKTREEILNEKVMAFVRGGMPGAEYSPRSLEFKITHADKLPIMLQRDLSKLTAGAGAATVPSSFVSRLYEHLVEVSAIRQAGSTVFTTDSGEDLAVPKTTAHSAAALTAEAGAIAESDPVFAQVVLQSFKYAILIQVSNELLTDTGIDLTGYLARQCGRGIGIASGAHFVTGTGTGQPRGAVTASTVGKTGTTGQTTTVTSDDLIDLYHSIVSGYRGRGSWLMNDSSVAKVRKLKDTTNQYIWQPGITAGQPDLLLGRPVFADPAMPVMAANAKSILFGDFSEFYAIRDVSTVRFERSDDFAFANDLVTFRAILRTDGDAIDETAVKHYANSAT